MSADRPSVKLMVTVMCAALYAVGSYVTAYIPSPWGFTGLGAWMAGNPTFGATTKSIIEILRNVRGAVLSALGLYFLTGKTSGGKDGS